MQSKSILQAMRVHGRPHREPGHDYTVYPYGLAQNGPECHEKCRQRDPHYTQPYKLPCVIAEYSAGSSDMSVRSKCFRTEEKQSMTGRSRRRCGTHDGIKESYGESCHYLLQMTFTKMPVWIRLKCKSDPDGHFCNKTFAENPVHPGCAGMNAPVRHFRPFSFFGLGRTFLNKRICVAAPLYVVTQYIF